MYRFALISCLAVMIAGCKPPPPPPTPAPPPKPAPPPAEPPIPPATPDEPSEACAERDKQLAALYSPYIDAYSNLGIELSPDGKTLLYRSDQGGGTYQLYLSPVDKPGAAPIPIASAKDGITDALFTPDGLNVLFIRDKDKNENYQLYRASTDGKELVPLTTALERFHNLPRVKSDWKTLVYLRGLHKTGGVALVSQSLDGGEAKVIMRSTGMHRLTDLSPDGKSALVFKRISPSQSQLFNVDLSSGKTTLLAPKKEPASHAHESAYSPDGKHVFVVTDEGLERAGLHKIDAVNGAVQATFVDPDGEVAEVKVSRKQPPVVAVQLDYGTHSSIKLLDSATLKEKVKVKFPMGLVTLGEFDGEGKSLVVNISTPSAPADVFALNVENGRLKALRRDKRPGLRKLPAITVKVERIVSFDETKVPVNVYLPKKVRGKKLPVVVLVHGGPASSSTIHWNPMVSFMVARGFAVLEPNVRGSTGFGKAYEMADNGKKRMDAVKDLESVNAWARQQPWADTERLVVMGGSYGGYMTYMALSHQPKLWRAGVGLVGLVNMATFLRSTTGAIRMAFVEEFGDMKKDAAFLRSISPIASVKEIQAPLFVYQGQNDPRVPRSEQDQLVNALRDRKIPVEYLVAADEGHSLSQRPNKLAFVSRYLRFLEQHLALPGLPAACVSGQTGSKAATSGEDE